MPPGLSVVEDLMSRNENDLRDANIRLEAEKTNGKSSRVSQIMGSGTKGVSTEYILQVKDTVYAKTLFVLCCSYLVYWRS